MTTIGLIWSIVKRFDTSFDVKLSTYSVPYMIGEIKRFIRDDGTIKVSRSIKELNTRIHELQKHYITKYGKEISLDELSKELKVSKEELAFSMEALNPIESIEKNVYNNKDDKEISLIDKISTGKNEEEMITNKIVIKELIEGLDKREKELIMLRFYKEKTQTQVAKILGITQVQVSRIERKILNSMKQKLSSG